MSVRNRGFLRSGVSAITKGNRRVPRPGCSTTVSIQGWGSCDPGSTPGTPTKMKKIQKIIKLYKKVQRIPYYCLTERDPNLLLRKNKGSCSEKHLYLGKEFEKLGIPVKYLLIKFNWNDLPISKEIISKKDSPIGWHLALKIKLNKKWILVDATWDPKLKKAGFPITQNWLGQSNTELAFKPIEIIELKKAPSKQIKRYENRKFYTVLNKWLRSQREKF